MSSSSTGLLESHQSEDLNELIKEEEHNFISNIEDVNASSLQVDDDGVISSENIPYTLSLRIKDFEDEKFFKKFIMNCEKLIRTSYEYGIWTNYIREALGYHECEITGEQHSQTRVDIHHHPFSLYTIVKAVCLKYIASDKEFCTYDICMEVIGLHYELKIPFCLLLKSLHDKFHNGFLNIPMELVKGDVEFFIKTYFGYLPDEDTDTISSRLAINKNNCGWSIKWIKTPDNLS